MSTEDTAHIWDAATGKELSQLGHTGTVKSAAYNRDGTQIITAGGDGTARTWSASTEKELHELTGTPAAFSPDGQFAVTGDGALVRVWSASTGNEARQFQEPGGFYTVAYNPDGTQIVTASETVRIWDIATGKEVSRPNTPPCPTSMSCGFFSVAYSPDGRYILTDNYLWDVSTGQEIHRFGTNTAAFSPDGKYIVGADHDNTVRIFAVDPDLLLAKAARLIQRDPPQLTPDERLRYGLE